MQIDFLPKTGIDPDSVEYGDVIITEKGAFLIVPDWDGRDYVGVNLQESYTTEEHSTMYDLLEEGLGGQTISRMIKKDDLILGVK